MARQRHYRNPVDAGICLFDTTTILDFVPVFLERKVADLAVVEMVRIHRKYGARLHAFVVMPEHIHLLLTLPPTMNAAALIGKLKSDLALAILPRLAPEVRTKFSMQTGLNRRRFWQRGYRGLEVEGEDMFWQKATYIHLNPVRRELVLYSEEYRWSSASLFLSGKWTPEQGLEFRMEDLPFGDS